MRFKKLLVTGGYGFIGSAFIRHILSTFEECQLILNVDLLTYAADLQSLASVEQDPRYHFVQGSICDEKLLQKLCQEFQIEAIVHFAAESHVDRSIDSPKVFFETNVRGTLCLLETVRRFPPIHFHHVSTDEVFGSLGDEGLFNETSPYGPNSPYSASKAAADHFVRAYAHTYGLSTTLSYACNNYGPFQHPEKLIPLMLTKCLQKEPLPIYGNGQNVRSWIYVDDHAHALATILEKAKPGSIYAIGAGCEKRNLDLLHLLMQQLADLTGEDIKNFTSLIAFVPDRLGHDYRYALEYKKLNNELGWEPSHSFEEGLKKTIVWHLQHRNYKIGNLC